MTCLGEVEVIPTGTVVAMPSSTAVFVCAFRTSRSDRITGVSWLVNGTAMGNLTNARAEFSHVGNGRGSLMFSRLPMEYNGTTIQCVVTINPPRPGGLSSSIATLLVQGIIKIPHSYVVLFHGSKKLELCYFSSKPKAHKKLPYSYVD